MDSRPTTLPRAFSRGGGIVLTMIAALVAGMVLAAPAAADEHDASDELVDAVSADAADVGLAAEADDVDILRVEAVTWADACLGAAAAGEFCAEVLTDGFVIWAQSGPEAIRYHTDINADNVRVGERGIDPELVDEAPLPDEANSRGEAPPAEPEVYTVQPGDTLGTIATQFGTTVTAIAEANNIANVNVIEVGQELVIPDAVEPPPSEPAPPEYVSYAVQPGDTLFAIASEHGTTVQAIIDADHPAAIPSPDRIEVGTVLVIPGEAEAPPTPDTYTVRQGDTLYSIAVQHGTTVGALADANDIANVNAISVGQVLEIP